MKSVFESHGDLASLEMLLAYCQNTWVAIHTFGQMWLFLSDECHNATMSRARLKEETNNSLPLLFA